jgi:hypothetical protein
MFDAMYGRRGAGRKNLRKSVRKDQYCFAVRRGYPFSGTPLPPAKTPPAGGVIHDAPRDWTYKRTLRQQGISELRQL